MRTVLVAETMEAALGMRSAFNLRLEDGDEVCSPRTVSRVRGRAFEHVIVVGAPIFSEKAWREFAPAVRDLDTGRLADLYFRLVEEAVL